MSTSDSFLPVQGDDALRDDAPLEREDHDSEDGNGPDVLPPDGSTDAAYEPPVADHTFFRTPTGESADPASD
jgi:hypothetical protein